MPPPRFVPPEDAKAALRASQTNFEKVEATVEQALAVSADLHDLYLRASPEVRRLINQGLFENLFVGTGLMRRARVVEAVFKEPLFVLARDLPEHVAVESKPPELVFLGVGSNSDCLVRRVGAYSNPVVQEQITRLYGLVPVRPDRKVPAQGARRAKT